MPGSWILLGLAKVLLVHGSKQTWRQAGAGTEGGRWGTGWSRWVACVLLGLADVLLGHGAGRCRN